MQKTRKSFAKRFKVTAGGKILRRTPGRRHLMRHKTPRQLKSSVADKEMGAAMCKQIRYAISAGL
ncbi:MAG: 50S ribosomal protein L35 [Opitutales bacterium]|nr:50S ribosomal protein L35 [Opitutales bacterium]